VEQARTEAQPRHLAELLKFAARAYRRPLAQTERDDLTAFYRRLREGGLEHEPAMRDLVVNVLMSPDFCYRIDLMMRHAEWLCARWVPSRAFATAPGLRAEGSM
jgi:hypothetical protein